MVRLLRAEWFRVRNSCHYPRWAALIWIILVLLPIVASFAYDEITVAKYMGLINEVVVLFIALFIGAFISVCIGMNYQNKTAYYEIMEGNTISTMIISRVIVYVTFMTCGLCTLFGIAVGILSMVNGIGEINKLPLRFILFVIIIIHICIVSSLIAISIRSLAALVFILLRFEVLEGICTMILPVILIGELNFKETAVQNISNWFILSQLDQVLIGTVDVTFVMIVIASLFVEGIFLYIVAFSSMKKREFR